MDLRRILGDVSIGKALDAVDEEHGFPSVLYLEVVPDPKGTPTQHERTGIPIMRTIPQLRPPTTPRSVCDAIDQLYLYMDDSTSTTAVSLTYALAEYFDDTCRLPEFSPMIIAAAILQVTIDVLSLKGFVYTDAIEDLYIDLDALRNTYNHLWLWRYDLLETIQDYGGNFDQMMLPAKSDGSEETSIICRDRGLSPPPTPLCVSLEFTARPSRLQAMSYPPDIPEDEDQTGIRSRFMDDCAVTSGSSSPDIASLDGYSDDNSGVCIFEDLYDETPDLNGDLLSRGCFFSRAKR